MRMQRTSLALVAAVALLAGCTKPAEDAAKPAATAAAGDAAKAASTVVATVNGQKLSSEVLDMFVQAVTSKPAAEATPEQKSQMLDQLINMALAAQAGEKEGVQNEADVKARIELLRMQILAEAATEKYIKAHPVSESEMKAEYDAQLANMPKEYKARHILVETKEKAEAIIKELAAGGDFAKIAGKESKDPGSGKNGGDLGCEFGWHVIQLEDTRSPEPPAFDDVKQQVEMFTQRKKLQAYLDDLRKNAKVQKSE